MKRKLHENFKRIEQRIDDACARVGRDPCGVKLVTVTKYATLDLIRTLVELKVQDLGENRVQELTKRAAMVREWLSRRSLERAANGGLAPPRWHMIGHLQRNKVRAVLRWVELIHSVDSLRLAEEIDAEAGRLGRRMPILIEVNASGESTKHGVAVAATTHLAEQLQTLNNIEVRGLMAMAPLTEDRSVIGHTFHRVRELFDEVHAVGVCGSEFKELSIGMSNDFECAIEVGATYVRIGSALFEGIELAQQSAQAD